MRYGNVKRGGETGRETDRQKRRGTDRQRRRQTLREEDEDREEESASWVLDNWMEKDINR